MVQRLILIRHGDLGHRYRGRYVGRTDAPLCPGGRRQAAALAGPLARLAGAQFWASPLRRARETAAIALGAEMGKGAAAGLSDQWPAERPFGIEADLREIDFGRWEGMSFARIAAADPAAVERWAALKPDFTFPDGEGIRGFQRRIAAVAKRIISDPARTVVLFTHGGVIRFLICRLLGLPARNHLLFDVRPASISEIRIDGGTGILTLLNDRRHLGDD